MSNAEIRLYRELCRLLGAIPQYQIPDDLNDAEPSIIDHPTFDVRDATELMRTIPSELRAYLCIPYERLLEIFRLVNECQRQAERTVTKMMEVGDTLDIDADSPTLEELAFKLRNDRASASDNGVTRRIVRPATIAPRQQPDVEALAPTMVLSPDWASRDTALPDLPSAGDTLPLPANDGESVEIDLVEASNTQTNQERILDALARISADMHRSEDNSTQPLQKSRWEERYQQKRLASYCFAGVVTGVLLAFGLAVAYEKLTTPVYATEIEVQTSNGKVQKIGFQSSQVVGLPPGGLHAQDDLSVDIYDDGQYLYTITLEQKENEISK